MNKRRNEIIKRNRGLPGDLTLSSKTIFFYLGTLAPNLLLFVVVVSAYFFICPPMSICFDYAWFGWLRDLYFLGILSLILIWCYSCVFMVSNIRFMFRGWFRIGLVLRFWGLRWDCGILGLGTKNTHVFFVLYASFWSKKLE